MNMQACAEQSILDWPLMKDNVTRADLDELIRFLHQEDPILTQSTQVASFEKEWSDWLGVPYSVFVNSGSSANFLTMATLRSLRGPGEIIVPTLCWVSDFASVIHSGFTPVPVDIDPRTLGMDTDGVIRSLSDKTRAVFVTHVLGYNALTAELLAELQRRDIPLIEDTCESYGATFGGKKLGTFGLMSNFSFYYGHHLTTVEGGMISTHSRELYDILRIMRSHGMVRESSSIDLKRAYADDCSDLTPDFIFAYPSFNMRSTELNAVIGRSQLKRLDDNNRRRVENLQLFLDNLDPVKYRTDFATEGSCNYALTLILQAPNPALRDRVEKLLRSARVEFRRGASGGGNQLRQPYVSTRLGKFDLSQFPNVEHVHFFGYYIGNYPTLDQSNIKKLCAMLNRLPD